MIRLVTLPGWMYITNNYVCFYASLPGKKVCYIVVDFMAMFINIFNNRKVHIKQGIYQRKIMLLHHVHIVIISNFEITFYRGMHQQRQNIHHSIALI